MKTAQQLTQALPQAVFGNVQNFPIDNPEVARLTQIIERQQQIIEGLESLARHDPLTGLLNRRGAQEALEKTLAGYRRYGHQAAVLLIDLNKFKPINDVHGHAAGDAMLCHVANILTQSVRSEDSVARMGGDEFLIILRQCTQESALHKARALAKFIAGAPLTFQQRTLCVGASIGLAAVTESHTVEGLLAIADSRMYAAKLSQ